MVQWTNQNFSSGSPPCFNLPFRPPWNVRFICTPICFFNSAYIQNSWTMARFTTLRVAVQSFEGVFYRGRKKVTIFLHKGAMSRHNKHKNAVGNRIYFPTFCHMLEQVLLNDNVISENLHPRYKNVCTLCRRHAIDRAKLVVGAGDQPMVGWYVKGRLSNVGGPNGPDKWPIISCVYTAWTLNFLEFPNSTIFDIYPPLNL